MQESNNREVVHTPSNEQVQTAWRAYISEQRRRERVQMIFTFGFLGVFTIFALAVAVPLLTFDKAKFTKRVESNVSEVAPKVIGQATQASKNVVAALAEEVSRSAPEIKERLAQKVAEETAVIHESMTIAAHADVSPATANYVDHVFAKLLTEISPELKNNNAAHKIVDWHRMQINARVRASLNETLKTHVAYLDEIQAAINKLRSEAKPSPDGEFKHNDILMATLDVMKTKLSSKEGLGLEAIASDDKKAAKGTKQ